MNTGWKEYLHFSRKETLGIIILLVIILAIALLPAFFDNGEAELSGNDFEKFRKELASLQATEENRLKSDSIFAGVSGRDLEFSPVPEIRSDSKARLFEFDPNTLSAEGWEKLGLNRKTITTIQRYLAKGGFFREPADIKKIYGLREEDRERLLPYIRIVPKDHGSPKRHNEPAAENYSPDKSAFNMKRTFVIDINKSDTAEWIALPGIGGKLAARIIKFREKLGGFYSVDQVAEIYGLQDSVFRRIRSFLRAESPELRKLNINKAEEADLNQHPYISRDLARSIVNYRVQHGKFASPEDLMQLVNMTAEVYGKLTPYISIE